MWKHGWNAKSGSWLALAIAAGALFANACPWGAMVAANAPKASDTEVLTMLRLPIVLWTVVGFAYVRGRWFEDDGRMNFVRFSGELAIYYVLTLRRGSFAALEHWQVAYLPVYSVWAALVVVVFPPVFNYH